VLGEGVESVLAAVETLSDARSFVQEDGEGWTQEIKMCA
jgi:hypothetical protein